MLVIDNCAIHHAEEHDLRLLLTINNPDAALEFLPAYSPHLNPVSLACIAVALAVAVKNVLKCAEARGYKLLSQVSYFTSARFIATGMHSALFKAEISAQAVILTLAD